MIIDNIVNFCKKYNFIICYGAGEYAGYVKCLLQYYKISIDVFLISNDVNNGMDMDGIPVCSFYKFSFPKEKCGVLLSLQSIYHYDVVMLLRKNNVNCDVFSIDDQIIKTIKIKLLNLRRNELLLKKGNFTITDKIFYDKKIQSFLEKYKKIKIDYIDMRQIGHVIFWIYLCEQKRDANIYYLYFPLTRVQVPESELRGTNAYLIKKLVYDNMEVISFRNIEFWNYFIVSYPDFFEFINTFDQYELSRRFNEFAVSLDSKKEKKYFFFNGKEKLSGEKFLVQNKIVSKFICFAARDSLYKNVVMKYNTDVSELAAAYRNMDVHDFNKMVQYLASSKIQAIRMGALVNDEIKWPNTIDYAYNFRNEFMDLYLFSKCEFFVCNPSGIQHLALLFSKPLVSVNAAVITTNGDPNLIVTPETDLAILKKYWNKKEKRYLTIKEMLSYEMNANKYHQTGPTGTFIGYHKDGIVPVDNTPEEILEVVKEMLKKLNGTVKYTEEDEKLQYRYQSIIDENLRSGHFPFRWRIGAAFLRKNSWLLD